VIRVRDADHARELLLRAMERRWRVTVGFWEVRTEYVEVDGVMKRRKVRVRNPVTGKLEDTYVHTVRTFEPFDVNGASLDDYFTSDWSDADYFTAMDAHPRPDGGPAVRRCRFDRVTDITIHKRHPYRMPNAHFMGRVRQHAAELDGEGWGQVAALTDEALWSLIKEAWSSDDAIEKAELYALTFEVSAT
jgi:hypothetical protein